MFTYPVLFAMGMATVDVLCLSLLKMKHNGQILGTWIFLVVFLIYGCQTFIFYKSLSYGSLAKMNMLWDITSDIAVTLIAIYLFKENLTRTQTAGLLLGMLAIYLLK
jgi:drug/metabolite transporter (DMT)-like permease